MNTTIKESANKGFNFVKKGLAALRDGLCLPFDILIPIKEDKKNER